MYTRRYGVESDGDLFKIQQEQLRRLDEQADGFGKGYQDGHRDDRLDNAERSGGRRRGHVMPSPNGFEPDEHTNNTYNTHEVKENSRSRAEKKHEQEKGYEKENKREEKREQENESGRKKGLSGILSALGGGSIKSLFSFLPQGIKLDDLLLVGLMVLIITDDKENDELILLLALMFIFGIEKTEE